MPAVSVTVRSAVALNSGLYDGFNQIEKKLIKAIVLQLEPLGPIELISKCITASRFLYTLQPHIYMELRNKDTGIDVSVPNYKEIKGMLGSSYEYHVMVVTNLSVFKTAKHKEKDNVQFVIPRKFADFEELFTKLNTKYSGTAFPPLPKKVLLMSDAVAKERRGGLDCCLKFLAMTPKLCTCPLLLEFLGVSPMKASKMRNIEVSDKIVSEQDKSIPLEKETEQDTQQDETEEDSEYHKLVSEQDKSIPPEKETEQETQQDETEVDTENLFDDQAEQEEDEDMFAGGSENRDVDTEADTKIFDEQELGGAIVEGEDNDLFLADAKQDITPTTDRLDVAEDNTDLFMIDDDLDSIMTLNLKPDHSEEPVQERDEINDRIEVTTVSVGKVTETESKTDQSIIPEDKVKETKSEIEETKSEIEETKSEIDDFDDIVAEAEKVINIVERPKPAPRKKPVVTKGKPDVPKRPERNKDKPEIPKRPEISRDKPDVPKRLEIAKEKPNVPKRPDVPRVKPVIPKRPEISDKKQTDSELKESHANNINEDDILKYIQENTANEDEVDLFS